VSLYAPAASRGLGPLETDVQLYGIIGAGGFGREVLPVAREMLSRRADASSCELVFVSEHPGPESVNGHRVMRLDAFLASGQPRYFNIAISDSRIRERLVASCLAAGAAPFSIVAASSLDLDDNAIGDGAILCPFTIVTSNARIGRFFHANIYSYVAHDCRIGDFVTFAPHVSCNGGVIVEDHAYIGTGAVLRQGTADRPIVIGAGAIVGMGAVVTRSVPPGTTVAGNPAAPLRKPDK
jgi:sugar O-acyltransferase (sialic acid O-acetyltransferase NeuD family)